MRPSAIAEREGFDIAVNGDFFSVKKELLPGYWENQWASVLGPAASGGEAWAAAKTKRPCLMVTKEGKVKVGQFQKAPTEARAVVAGNQILLEGGKDVTPEGNKD